MHHPKTASARFQELNAKRRGLITRCEKYAEFTVPKICLKDGYDENNVELQHDYQSVGAQAVRHVVNKLMLALFAPSRPAMRLDLSTEAKNELGQAGVSPNDLVDVLAAAESDAWKGIDREAMRPKLYELMTHLVVTGNGLLDVSDPKDGVRVIGLKHYVVKRNQKGKVIEVIQRDCLDYDELVPEVQAVVPNRKPGDKVEFYRWVLYRGKKYWMTQWVDQQLLPTEFGGSWPEDQMPLRPLTWDLADGNDYGTGLVEDYQGDFAALSMMSKAMVEAAIMTSEFRWLVNPAGQTKPEDLRDSSNGEALPGIQGDISLVSAGTQNAVPHLQTTAADYINRIGRGFLLGSAVTRHAERVTAEEIRMQAEELETSLGGAYSRIAVDLQTPLAYYLLRKINFKMNGKAITPVIVTGLDALSRNGDLTNLMMFLSDLSAVDGLSPETRQKLNLDRVVRALAAGRGLSASEYIAQGDQAAPAVEAPPPEAEAAPPPEQGAQPA